MKMKIWFPKALIWGSIALLLFALAGCPLPADPVSEPPGQEDTDESRGQDSEDNPENEDGDNEGQNSGDEQNDPEGDDGDGDGNGDDGDSGDDSDDDDGDDNNDNNDGDGGDDDNDAPGENEEDENGEVPALGDLVIRIGEMAQSEGVYPDLSGVTQYLLDFNAENGKTAESVYLEPENELTVTLDAGNWEIRAYGLAENEAGEPLLATIFGTTRVTVRENETETVLIVPDGPAAEGDYFEIDGVIFPPAISFSSTSELKAFLDTHPVNNENVPYPVKITGVDLSSKEGTGETLKTLYNALSRYVTLDLRECTGTELISASISPALAGRKKIVSLILPDSVTSIAANGFSGYEYMKSVIMPQVTTIGTSTFKDCKQLEVVSAPALETVASAKGNDTGAFIGCTVLKTLNCPALVTLGNYAFYNCSALTETAFPNLRIVGAFAFKGCTALKSINLPVVTKIDKNSFENDTALTDLTLGPTPPELGKNAFGDSNFLQNGTLSVPSGAVDTYKESSPWSVMEDRIYPITD
jgi:hypothetical protein